MTSEFGRGYAVCLRQFLWHEPRLADDVALYEAMRAQNPDLFREERAVEMWADGAVDHLLDIVRPRRYVTPDEWKRAKALRDLMYAAKWGRLGFSDAPRSYTAAEMREALSEAERLLHSYAHRAGEPLPETFDAAWRLDEAAGLRPERGESATCEGPIPTRSARAN